MAHNVQINIKLDIWIAHDSSAENSSEIFVTEYFKESKYSNNYIILNFKVCLPHCNWKHHIKILFQFLDVHFGVLELFSSSGFCRGPKMCGVFFFFFFPVFFMNLSLLRFFGIYTKFY